MILAAIVLFGLASLIGLYMIFIGVFQRRGSRALGLAHAAIALVALIVLVYQLFHVQAHPMRYNEAAILFVLTLVGGLVLLALRQGREPPPMGVVGVHAAIAIYGLLLLVSGFLSA